MHLGTSLQLDSASSIDAARAGLGWGAGLDVKASHSSKAQHSVGYQDHVNQDTDKIRIAKEHQLIFLVPNTSQHLTIKHELVFLNVIIKRFFNINVVNK
jgi:hypothetical protein